MSSPQSSGVLARGVSQGLALLRGCGPSLPPPPSPGSQGGLGLSLCLLSAPKHFLHGPAPQGSLSFELRLD